MKTDRELLALAAKAAGIQALDYPDGVWRNCTGADPAMHIFAFPQWDPLRDDGDALRLAVRLNIQITPGTYNKDEFTAFKAAGGEAHEFRHYQQDEYAATRRAIVRAAAEIGRASATT